MKNDRAPLVAAWSLALLGSAARLAAVPPIPPGPDPATLEQGCSANQAADCLEWGRMLRDGGDGVEVDAERSAATLQKAVDLAEKGCAAQAANDCTALADAYRFGWGVAKDQARGLKLAEQACGLGAARACLIVARGYELGWGAAPDLARCIEFMKLACAKDLDIACHDLGMRHLKGFHGITPDKAAAAGFLERGCALKNADSCHALAKMVNEGDGVPRDSERGRRLFIYSCEGGRGDACYLAAFHFVNEDPARAAQLFLRSCDMDDYDGCRVLGLAYQHGDLGLTADPAKALGFYVKACEGEPQGVTSACADLGKMYEQGIGTVRSLKRAKVYYAMACERHDDGACQELKKLQGSPSRRK
jgi:hypothetical protein